MDRRSRSITVHSFDPGRRQYGVPKRFGTEDNVRSTVLAGFEAEVAALFPPSKP